MALSAPRFWAGRGPLALALLPPSWLFRAVAAARRAGYRHGWLRQTRLPVPVIVVGNIDVGGSGKTPLTIALVELLRRHGLRPGIVSRGYRGSYGRNRGSAHGSGAGAAALAVTADSDPALAGDEPVLLARRCRVPVRVAADRAAAGRQLLADTDCNVIVADDGLQHYALARDLEICLIDAARGLGNRWCLPAGPLREPPARLRTVDFIVRRRLRAVASSETPETAAVDRLGAGAAEAFDLWLYADRAVSLADPAHRRPLSDWRGRRVHAVAAIGRPEGFFALLRGHGIEPVAHPFADHRRFGPADFPFAGDAPLLLTEKDAVKCRVQDVARTLPDAWYVPLRARLDARFESRLMSRLQPLLAPPGAAGRHGGGR